MTFEQKMARLRPEAPTVVSLLTAMHDRPDVAQLDDWVYCCSGSYETLGKLLSEMHPAYDGLTIKPRAHSADGHNAFEEFVILVWETIAIYHCATDGKTYDIDKLTGAFIKDILCEHLYTHEGDEDDD
jgi:hypothetical protein